MTYRSAEQGEVPFLPIKPYLRPAARVKLAPDLSEHSAKERVNYVIFTDKMRLEPKLTSIVGRWISLLLFFPAWLASRELTFGEGVRLRLHLFTKGKPIPSRKSLRMIVASSVDPRVLSPRTSLVGNVSLSLPIDSS